MSKYVTGLQEMNTLLHIRNITVAVFMYGKSDAVLIVTIQSKGLLGI